MSQPKVWLITGASSGFGRLMTELTLTKGNIVVATARRPETLDDLKEKHSSDQLLVLKCDVTNKQDITNTFGTIFKTFGRLDIVFNNAACFYVAEVESQDQDDEARRLFEANFWGAANIATEAVRAFRDLNPPGEGGLLLTVGSHCAHGVAGAGYYDASKAALESLMIAMANELDPAWNIKISLIIPGTFKTRLLQAGAVPILPPHPAYTNQNLPSIIGRQAFQFGVFPGADPGKAVEKMYDFSELESRGLYFVVGQDGIKTVQGKIESLNTAIKEYGSWSADMDMYS